MTERDKLVHRIECLETANRDQAEQFQHMSRDVAALQKEVAWLRTCLPPQPNNCPKCGARVGKTATRCQCGAVWGPSEDRTGYGLPR